MTRLETFAKELRNEGVMARRMLERIPNDKYDWRPHPKSMNIRSLSTHIAELPAWISMTLVTDGLDFAATPYAPTHVDTTAEVLNILDKSLEEGIEGLGKAQDATLDATWVLRNGDQVYSTSSKEEVIRMSINQIVHHRAQLGVFLRLLDIPIPGTYGPSADESF